MCITFRGSLDGPAEKFITRSVMITNIKSENSRPYSRQCFKLSEKAAEFLIAFISSAQVSLQLDWLGKGQPIRMQISVGS